MAFYKVAEGKEQEYYAITIDEAIRKTEKSLRFVNENYGSFLDVIISDDKKTFYVYMLSKNEEAFFLEITFNEPFDLVYYNHDGDEICYHERISCTSGVFRYFFFAFLQKEDVEDYLRRMMDIDGDLSFEGDGALIKGCGVYDYELFCRFKMCRRFVAEEEYKALLTKMEGEPIFNDSMDDMDGHEFESFCADLLRSNGFSDVEITKGSGDQGVDVIAYKDFVKYGFQCKCYSSDVGNKAVQEAFAGKTYYGCHVAVVLTNRYFTPAAKELAEQTGVVLWDRDKLLSMTQ